MTLLKGKTAKLKLLLEIQELPKKDLVFEFEDKTATSFYTLNVSEVKKSDLKKASYSLDSYLSITAKEECSKQQILLAKSDGKVCGKLIIYANAKTAQRKIKVVFVQVQLDINPKKPSEGVAVPGGYEFFKDCLHQALVMPQNNCETVSLDCQSSWWGFQNTFRNIFCSKNSSGSFSLDTKKTTNWYAKLKNYLEETMEDQYGDTYKEYYRVYFIGEKCHGLNGYSYTNTQFGVYFSTHQKATIAHELFHAMGLPHTFDGVNPKAVYTYEGTKTDNILDYSHHVKTPRRSLFEWQWKALNPNMGRMIVSERVTNIIKSKVCSIFKEEDDETLETKE